MAALFFLPILAAAITIALLCAIGTLGIAYMPDLAAAWATLAGLGAGLVTLCLATLLANRRLNRRIKYMADDAMRFEAGLGKRLDLMENRVAAGFGSPAGQPNVGKIGPIGIAPASQPAEANQADRSERPTKLDVFKGDENVIQLESAGRGRGLREKIPRLSHQQVVDAMAQQQLDAWFQPVVSLPERSPKYLAGFPFLATANNGPAEPGRWLETAQRGGYGAEIEHFMLLESVRLVRELSRKAKKTAIIWHFGRQSLADPVAWAELTALLKANRALNGKLVCAINLADYGQLNHDELDRLYMLRETGFKIALLNCTDLKAVSNALKSGIFAMVGADVAIIADAARLEPVLSRANPHAIMYVATGVAHESDVIALIDRDILLAQGPLFALPKPLARSETGKKNPEGAV